MFFLFYILQPFALFGCVLFSLILYFWPTPTFNTQDAKAIISEYVYRIKHKQHETNNFNQHQQEDQENLKGIVIAISGVTSGIGLELATYVHDLGATVIGIGRSENKLENLKRSLESNNNNNTTNKEEGKDRFIKIVGDYNDLSSVSSAADEILKLQQRDVIPCVDFLINNAGINNVPHDKLGEPERTAQGYDMVFGVNYLSHVLLTEKLLPLLELSHNDPRIVFLCSNFFRGVSGSALSCPDRMPPAASGLLDTVLPSENHAYANSKFAQILYMRALSKKLSLSSSHVGVLSVCPGGVVTNIHTSKKGLASSFCFSVDVSIKCLLNAMFLPNIGFHGGIDYIKNIPTLPVLRPSMKMSDEFNMIYLFVMAVLTMPLQKLLYKDRYFEKTSVATYNKTLRDDLYVWTMNEIQKYV